MIKKIGIYTVAFILDPLFTVEFFIIKELIFIFLVAKKLSSYHYSRYSLITKQLSLDIWKKIGIFCHLKKLKTLHSQNRLTGTTDLLFQTRVTKNLMTGINLNIFLILKLLSQKTGTMKWMGSGKPQ